MQIAVIGGGAAGMMAAVAAAEQGCKVLLFEKNDRLGKKLYITGKGRCNITNMSDVDEMLQNIPSNPYFMYSSLYGFDSTKVVDFFESAGVPTKVERGNRVFPQSDKASDVVKALESKIRANKVEVHYKEPVTEILVYDKRAAGIKTSRGNYKADAVILATGGLSYPQTGSTGDGYKMAKSLGHKITKLYPSLVPLKTKEFWCFDLQGLSLKNVEVTISDAWGKKLYSDFGEMLFTHFGVSGPVILSASSHIRIRDDTSYTLSVDLKPALSEKTLDARILRDFEKYKNKELKNALVDLLPSKIIPAIILNSGIDPNKKVNEITKPERHTLLSLIKSLKCTILSSTGFNDAVITSGGIETGEINPSTMESKIISNLYFAGEIIDVDGYTGGFNLQIAFSTGHVAGVAASVRV